MESVIESQSSDGGSHDLCHGSQKDDLVFDHPFPLPHGNIPVNPHGIGRWDDTVKDGIGKALSPNLSCQPSGMNWEQKMVETWPQRYSISSNRSLCS